MFPPPTGGPRVSLRLIIVGHTRYKAALQLGLESMPVHVARGLSPAQVKAYRLADNQTAKFAEWDPDLLPLELAELDELEFDLELLGFPEDELAEWLNPSVKDGLADPDDVPDPPDAATTQPGDLWVLGEHRLLCGDSVIAEQLDRLLDGAPIHLVNTDPPYSVKVEPRSNNAIAAGLSSFEGNKHHQKFDVERHPGKGHGCSNSFPSEFVSSTLQTVTTRPTLCQRLSVVDALLGSCKLRDNLTIRQHSS